MPGERNSAITGLDCSVPGVTLSDVKGDLEPGYLKGEKKLF